MNEETKDALAAIGGNAGAGDAAKDAADTAVDYKSEYEKALKSKEQFESMANGRLRKANEENQALRRELEELKAKTRTADAISALPDEVQAQLSDGEKTGVALIAQHTVDKAIAGRDERLGKIEERINAGEERQRLGAVTLMIDRLKVKHPGFVDSIKPGGPRSAAWAEYLRWNAATVSPALANGDFDTVDHHVSAFLSQTGAVSQTPEVQDGSAAPEPRATGGGSHIPADGKKTYTLAEYDALARKARSARDAYDFDTYRKMMRELDEALAEGRVK